MLYFGVDNKKTTAVYVRALGIECDSSSAHWGPGVRSGYILHYVINGSGYFNGQKVSAGEGFFINNGELHEYYSDVKNPWQYFWIIFNGDADEIKNCLSETGLFMKNHVFRIEFTHDLRRLIEKIECEKSENMSSAKALSYFYSLISMHEKPNDNGINISAPEAHIRAAVSFMENNYHLPVKMTDIARHICVDNQYMYNIFKKYINDSPKNVLSRIRIEKACDMLKNTSLPISVIGESVGYCDSLSFSVFFKIHMGVSPQNYRSGKKGTADNGQY